MVNIRFNDFKVESVMNNSGIFSGENIHTGIKATHKVNQGYGAILGNHNPITKGKHMVVDDDQIEFYQKKKT
ncbi:hypothetical protein [Priestia koreensis]|uniref:Uncharacterized protein n=1 Tax=Priestia koreensis TaxID=284581 RepID=A0A0M0L5K5_9BACI|nr:hypothetical protein [Priestia koreensis]KOO46324.1 hypothetical protein AMD01_10780 [Priestia koreensis]